MLFQIIPIYLHQIKNEIKMKGKDLIVGSIIEALNGVKIWERKTITRVSDKYVWFNNSGYARIAKTTFDNYPQLYRIISL